MQTLILKQIYNSLMALPTNLASKIKSVPMDPTVMASELELGYLLSFSQNNITHDSIYTYPRQIYQSPLQNYQFTDFEEQTYQQLLQETSKASTAKCKQLVKGIRCGFKEYYARIAANLHSTALRFVSREKNQAEKKFTLAKEQEEVKIEALKGNNPQKWPESIRDFIKQVNNLSWFSFSNDSELFLVEFIESAKNAIINLCKKSKLVDGKYDSTFRQNLFLEIQALLGVSLRTANQSFILQQLKFLTDLKKYLDISPQFEQQLCDNLLHILNKFFNTIPQQPASKYHYPQSLWNKQPFLIMKKKHFQKFNGLAFYSITTDGKYLYVYISAINGGMFKVGTGNGDTKAGKIYYQRELNYPIGTKVDQISWVYLKGKLYLKSSSRDPWILEVIDVDNFKKEGNIQLFCPSLFGHQSLINLNKNTPILTDGNSLYYLGSRVKIQKVESVKPVEPQQAKKNEKSPEIPSEEKAIQKKLKKKIKKNQNQPPQQDQKNQNFQKVLEIVLYQFSFDQTNNYENDDQIDINDINQLYDSFSGYFSKAQCKRAFVLNDYDLAQTCQWLFNQGQKEKEKNIKIYEHTKYVILAESQITSNFQQKNIKGPSQIAVKDGSLLNIQNLTQSIWTMDNQNITCYSQTGVKVFSINKSDYKFNAQTKLGSSILKTLQSKFPKNPQYNIIYDPYNLLFYTFSWPQDGHYFPTIVLTSNDKKNIIKCQQAKRFNAEIKGISKLNELSKIALHHMNLLDKGSIKNRYRFSDWMWYYGQKIIEIGTQMNQAEADKKKLTNKRTKFIGKMNKINDMQKRAEKDKAALGKSGKILREVIKIYPFQSQGTIKNYKLITEAFKDISEHPQNTYLYTLCIQNWLSNCSVLSNIDEMKEILIEIGQNLFKLKQVSNGKNRSLINSLILQQFYLFYPTVQRQIKFIISLNEDQLKQFIKSQSIIEKKQKQSIVFELTKKQQIIQKYQFGKCDFSDIFRLKSSINSYENSDIELIGNLLLPQIFKIDNQTLISKKKHEQVLKKQLIDYLAQHAINSSIGNKFIQHLFLNSFKMLNTNTKNLKIFSKLTLQLYVQIFKIYEKIILKSKADQLHYILPSFLMFVQLYHGSLAPLSPNQQIITSLIKTVQYIQKPQFNEALSVIQESDFQGISPSTQKVYETSHPLQRGKNYNFPQRCFPKALLTLLDLDRRCQSDPNNDTLSIQILHQDNPVGNNIQINDGIFFTNLRLSGAVQTKKPYLIFGNSVNVDFNSSGQVKDTQSLVRYGFKFGFRPVYSGKINLQNGKKDKIQKAFNGIHNFQTFVNTIKFTAIAISNSIENLLHLQNQQTDLKLSQLLKNKIFKEGFQQNSYKFDNRPSQPFLAINSFMSKIQHESQDKNIIFKTHQKIWKSIEEEKKNEKDDLKERNLWNLEGIPSYIKSYLEQIQNFKGDFIDVFHEARQLAKEKGSYAHMMRRKTFQDKHKQFWLQGEAILFLTILKHSGLLHLNLKFSIQYIKQNLKAFEDARDGIYYSLISRIQNVNQWRDLIQTYTVKDAPVEVEKKEQPEQKKAANINISVKRKGKTIKSMVIGGEQKQTKKEKVQQKPVQKIFNKAQFQKTIRERLSNNEALIKGICNLRKIRYDEINQFETVTRIIQEVIKASQNPLQSPQSVYTEPIEHLIRCCLFLLKFRSPSAKQSLQSNEQIVPVNIGRSLSSDNRNVNANKVNIFREWLENWKKWKGFKKQGRIQLRFPVEQIVKYINSWTDLSSIQEAIQLRYRQCNNRIGFYSNNNTLFKTFSNNILIKYLIGTQTLHLGKEYNSSLSSINLSKLKQLEDVYLSFRDNLKGIESFLMQKLPKSLSEVSEISSQKPQLFLQKIKIALSNILLLQSDNPQINLQYILYFLAFKFLSNSNEDIIYIINALAQRAFIASHTTANIVQLLEKEVGRNNISYKRWKDLLFIERTLFLVRKLDHNCRKKIAVEEKVKISELMFFILYHIEVPLINRACLKILKRLKIDLKSGIRTPLQYQYSLYSLTQKIELKETFKLQNSGKNNIQLLCSKISSIFKQNHKNELSLKFLENPKQVRKQEQQKFNIVLNLHQEEDLYWLIKVLYYIDELERKRGEKVINEIKDFQQFLALKNKKKQEKENKRQQAQNNPNPNNANNANNANNNTNSQDGQKDKGKQPDRKERIFSTLPKYPKINQSLQSTLPLGWFFNYCNTFGDPIENSVPAVIQKPAKPQNGSALLQNALKNQRPNKNNNNNNNNNNNTGKKPWNTPIFTRLAKKYEQLNSKPIQQPKQADSIQLKQQFIKGKNLQSRMRKYFIQISILLQNFSRCGYYLFKEDITRTKMNQICQFITAGAANRLKDIEVQIANNDVAARFTVNDFAPNFSSKMKITLIKTKYYSHFEQLLALQSMNAQRVENSASLIGRKELSLGDSEAFLPFEEFIPLDEPTQEDDAQFGKQWIQCNFSRMKKRNERVYLNDYPNSTFYIGQGGIESGVRDNILIPANDSSLTLQTTLFENILTQPKNRFQKQYEDTQFPQQLMTKIQSILQRGSISIEKKQDIRQYLLLTFYLRKLNSHDLTFVEKQASARFTQKLFKFTANLRSYQELSQYQQDVQRLLIKLIDNSHERLHLFGHYLPDEGCHPEIEEYLVPLKLQKLNSTNEVRQESAQTHCSIKSKYLLKSQPPQIQQNKLLKYWQKNILPRILEFVKTTLKPLQIQDFWQQMRRPLRVGDHTDAKRVAYIICDNKLPAGAVIPDANHNWNSLQLEQITVGENVLVKLPKQRSGQFSTPLLSWGYQEHRLARIVFIDTRTSSVLVRYRVEELSLFSYTWVPVNALMAVERDVLHISTPSIFEELQKKLEGMVYIHAKNCLTKLARKVAKVDNIKLIKETILDLFIKNPISGFFDFPKPVWTMRPIFEQLLAEGNHAVFDLLQSSFCPVRGIDLDLTSQNMLNLNRFDDAKALIVSFKKQSKLAQCSGVHFFNDKYGYNQVAHVYTAKSERSDLQPLEFNDPNLYCSFYTNKQCLSISQQNSYKIYPLGVTVFAIDGIWTIGCYLADVMCEIATANPDVQYIKILERINRIFFKWILKKSVTVLCAHLAKIISKISLTITNLCEKNGVQQSLESFGVSIEQLKDLMVWISKLVEDEAQSKLLLYSSLLQNLSEMTASILFKLPPNIIVLPEHVKSTVELLRIFKQLDHFIKTKKLTALIPNSPPSSSQWERILHITNIPQYFDRSTLTRKLIDIFQLNKGKILCPSLDVFFKQGDCFILVDGWDVNELVEEQVMQKMEQQEEKQNQEVAQEEMGMMTWICPACTFENPTAFNVCDMCQSAAPVIAKQEEVYEEIQATDLKAAERKIQERQAKRFEQVKVQIQKFFEDQYKLVCEEIGKKAKQIQEAQKNNKQPARKNAKKQEVVKEQAVLELPKKPQVKIQTGSGVFQNPKINDFLQIRFQNLPKQLKKLAENEDTYIAKFKKFHSLGYDLWGDNISNENATLIPFNLLEMLMDYIQTDICKGSSSVLSYSQDSIRILSHVSLLDSRPNEIAVNYITESDMGIRVKYKQLASMKSYNIRYSWKFVKELNLAASNCFQFVNMDIKFDKERNDSLPIFNDSLGYKLKYFRNLVMGVIKLELFQKIIQKTSVARQNDQVPRVQLERLKARQTRVKEGLVANKEKEDHLFTKAHSQFLKISSAFLRPFKPKGTDPYLSFTVTFKGENVMGEAGPYRQFFTDIARELHPSYNLGLFIPSPNNRHQSGEHKSKWVINPKANSTYHFSLFEYIGILMGCCFRTGGHLALDLPLLFWKSITHQQINEQDLEQVDQQLVSLIRMLKDCPSEQALSEATDATSGQPLTWTYRTLDDEIHELIPNGKNITVLYSDLNKYIDALRNKKILESRLQVKRITQGLSQLIPLPYLHCLTGEELKLIICGRPKVDVDLLKKHTKYSGGLNDDSRRIKFFWQIMRELSEIDRLKIIRFCWGQQRLPINSEQFQRNNIRFMIKPMLSNNKNQDQALPKADTCFFNIELPDYSTKVIMKQKILLAVNLDNVSINADENNNEDNPLMNEIDSYEQEEDYED